MMMRCAIAGLFAALLLPSLSSGEVPPEAKAAIERRAFGKAERILRKRLDADPADAESRFQYARVLAWRGRTEPALREYATLLRAQPANSDFLLGKALAHIWDGHPDLALPLLRRARRLAPAYEDVWRAQINALIAIEDEDRLWQAHLIAQEARRRFPRSRWSFPALDEEGPAPDARGATSGAPER